VTASLLSPNSDLSAYQKAAMRAELLDSNNSQFGWLNIQASDIIGEGTYSYNCHAYAWHLTEGNTNQIWINRGTGGSDESNLSKYWDTNAGCFVQVDSESFADKIYYYTGDHSAIKSIVSGKYESKWGDYPLVRHTPTQVPYTSPGNRKYYIKSPRISGPDSIYCDGPGYYTVENLPSSISGSQITWTCSSNLQLGGGNTGTSKTIDPFLAGYGWVMASFSLNGSLISVRKSITIISTILPISITNNGNYFHAYIAADPDPPASYEWRFNSMLAGGNTAYLPYSRVNNDQSIINTLRVTASNGCSSSTSEMTVYGLVYVPEAEWEESISYYPNPASTLLTVSIDGNKYSKSLNYLQAMSQNGASQKLSPSFTVRLYTSQGVPIRQQNIDSGNSSTQFNVSGLYPGLYFLYIHDNLCSKTILRKITIQ
jgi:hypothetical protein